MKKINVPSFLIILLFLFFILGNDLRVKSGNVYPRDFEGAGVVNLILFALTIVATLACVVILKSYKKEKLWVAILFSSLIPISIFIYISYFDFYGLMDDGNVSKNKMISKQNGLYIKELNYSDSVITNGNDTIKLLNGWSEKQHIVDHTHLIKIYDDTSTVNYIIKLKGNHAFDNSNIFYQVNNKDFSSGANSIDSLIKFDAPRSSKKIVLTFFKMFDNNYRNTKAIKDIILK